MTDIWNTIFYHPVVNLLLFMYKVFGNLGIAIILLTIIVRIILAPLAYSQFKSARKLQELRPKLAELKEKHGKDKQRHLEEQRKLYKEHGVNPASSFFSLLIQIPIIFALYISIRTIAQAKNASIFNNIAYSHFLTFSSSMKFNLDFLGMNLSKYAAYFKTYNAHFIGYVIIAILVAASQYYSGRLTLAQNQPAVVESNKTQKKNNSKDSTAISSDDFMKAINTQTLYFIPVFLFLISYGLLGSLPIAVSIYWIVQSVFVIIQILLTDYLEKIKVKY